MSISVRERSPFDEQRGRDHEQRERGRSRSYSPPGKREREDRERVPNVGNNTQWQEPHLKKARLFVGNIDPNKVERCELIDIFSQYGNVLGVSVHKGFAFVQMDSERNANRAANEENGSVINGQKIHVEFSSAALKAGARFKRLPLKAESPPPKSSYRQDLQDDFVEERMSRVLALERELEQELAYIKSVRREEFGSRRGGSYSGRYGSYDRSISPPPYREDSYQRSRSPPSHAFYGEPSTRSRYGNYSQYSGGSGWGQDRQSGRASYSSGGSSFQSGWR